MSYSFSGSNGLRITGLTLSGLASPAQICFGMWIKRNGAGSSSHWLGEVRQANDGGTRATLRLDTGMAVHLRLADENLTNDAYTSGTVSDATWTHVYGYFDDPSNAVYSGIGATNSTVSTRAGGWPGANAATCIKIGTYWESSVDYFVPSGDKIALPYLAKRPPTSGELTSLAGGAHPQAIFGADLIDYWPPNSKTSGINGWVLSDVGSTVSIDTGDNPNVEPASSGAMAFSGASAISAIAAAGTATMSGTSRQFSMTLYQEDGVTPLAGRTGLWYAWWPSIAAARTAAASIYGTGASTNGSGQITFAAPSGLSVGNNQGYGVISDQDATADAAEIAYVGSFDVI